MRAVPRRVVITGAGVVSPLGAGVEPFWDALAAGRSGVAAFEIEAVGAIPAFPVMDGEDARERFGQRDARRMDRSGRLAAVAAALAMEDAGEPDVAPERVGVSIGSVHGGAETLLEAHRALLERGPDRVGPLAIPSSLPNHPCAAAARALGLRGPSNAPATACAAGADAIGVALGMIRDGRADMVVAGGADAPLSPLVVAGYIRVGALNHDAGEIARASRPFDCSREGFVIGEGAGMLVLEERDHALARGARIHAELAGYGSSCDAGHPTDPDQSGEGPARAIAEALAEAGLTVADVGYVNAHATSTLAGDLAEARALVRAGLAGATVSFDQVGPRPRARGRRRAGGRGHPDGVLPGRAAGDAEPRGARPRGPLRPRPGAAVRAHRRRHLQLLRLRRAQRVPGLRPPRRRRGRGGVAVRRILLLWAFNAVALIVADWLVDGIRFEDEWVVIPAGAVFGIVNWLVKPIVTLFSLPVIILTLGIALFFVNLLMLYITSWIVSGFDIDGFWSAVGATIVIWVVNSVLVAVFDVDDRRRRRAAEDR